MWKNDHQNKKDKESERERRRKREKEREKIDENLLYLFGSWKSKKRGRVRKWKKPKSIMFERENVKPLSRKGI